MTRFLMRAFKITDEKNPANRKKAGFLAGFLGVAANLLLFIIKIIIGLVTASVSVVADAFNNLSDMASSIVTIVGFKMADMPADEEHPFGHGRIEYISAFVVSLLIILAGFELLKSSAGKVIEPSETSFSLIAILVLALTIPIKMLLSNINFKLGKFIGSAAIEAASADSRNDVIVTLVTIISALLSKFLGFYVLDGYIGALVALFIMYSGFSFAKETIEPLLGGQPDCEMVKKIEGIILKGSEVCGIHDLIVHNYGPDKYIASAHAEVRVDADILKVHDEIDLIERQIMKEMGVQITIHIDPISTDNKEVNALKEMIGKIVSDIDEELKIHDFRVVSGDTHTNLIFDVVVPHKFKMHDKEIKAAIDSRLDENYFAVIVFDRSYI